MENKAVVGRRCQAAGWARHRRSLCPLGADREASTACLHLTITVRKVVIYGYVGDDIDDEGSRISLFTVIVGFIVALIVTLFIIKVLSDEK